jgi:hypothetical protein
MECNCSSHPVYKIISEDLKTTRGMSSRSNEHLTASKQPRKYSKDTLKMEVQKNPRMTSEVLGSHDIEILE